MDSGMAYRDARLLIVYESLRAVDLTVREAEGEEGCDSGSSGALLSPKPDARGANERVGVVGMLIARRGVPGVARVLVEAIGVGVGSKEWSCVVQCLL